MGAVTYKTSRSYSAVAMSLPENYLPSPQPLFLISHPYRKSTKFRFHSCLMGIKAEKTPQIPSFALFLTCCVVVPCSAWEQMLLSPSNLCFNEHVLQNWINSWWDGISLLQSKGMKYLLIPKQTRDEVVGMSPEVVRYVVNGFTRCSSCKILTGVINC